MRSRTASRLVVLSSLCLVVCIAGCNSSSNQAAEAQRPAAKFEPPPLPHTFTTAAIHDPSLNNVLADTMTIPSGWKLEGTILMAPCTTVPWPVYRAYSPDGLTEMRQMPTLGWRWSPQGYANTQGCLDIHQTITASQFLQHFITSIPGGVHIVGPMPTTPALTEWANGFADRLNNQPVVYEPARAVTTADTAALHIQTHNGTFTLDQRLRAVVICSVNSHRGAPLEGGNCWGRVDVLRAPEGHLDALVRLVDDNRLPKPVENPQWQQAALARDAQHTHDIAAELFRMQAQAHNTFQAMHEQFMATMQQNFQSFQAKQEDQFNHFQANMAAQHQVRDNVASDWVDYALDQQTVTGQGGTVHLSNQYAHTWSSTVGNETQWFQTDDINSNPNNVLYGNWTEDTKVHGNGQPY